MSERTFIRDIIRSSWELSRVIPRANRIYHIAFCNGSIVIIGGDFALNGAPVIDSLSENLHCLRDDLATSGSYSYPENGSFFCIMIY